MTFLLGKFLLFSILQEYSHLLPKFWPTIPGTYRDRSGTFLFFLVGSYLRYNTGHSPGDDTGNIKDD